MSPQTEENLYKAAWAALKTNALLEGDGDLLDRVTVVELELGLHTLLNPISKGDIKDLKGCGHADLEEEEVYFHSACHMDQPTWVKLEKDQLTVICSVCQKPIVSFQITK